WPRRTGALGRGTGGRVRWETEPGGQRKRDGAVQRPRMAGQRVEVHFGVSTLSYSRRFHFWGTDSEDAEHTYEAVVRAFEWFGGVPGEVLVDNQKCAVIAHRRGGGGAFNPPGVGVGAREGVPPPRRPP